MDKILNQNWGFILLGVAGIYFLNRTTKVFSKLNNVSAAITKPIVNAIVGASHDGVKHTRSEFYLNPDKLSESAQVIDNVWWRMIQQTVPNGQQMLDAVFMYGRIVRPEFRSYIGNIIDLETIKAVQGG